MKCFLLLFISVVFGIPQLNAQTPEKWKTYNHKNGYTIQLPDFLEEGLLVAGGSLQWYTTKTNNEVEVTVEWWGNGSQDELEASYLRELKTYPDAIYKVLKPGWFVISGREKEEPYNIYYNKTINKNGRSFHLRITYPETSKALMDKVLGRISASFK